MTDTELKVMKRINHFPGTVEACATRHGTLVGPIQTDITGFPDVVRGGDYPQAWSRTYGKGRSFYTSLGHRDDIWSNDPVFRAHVRGGIRWALGLEN